MDSVAYHLGLIFSRRLSTLSSKFAFRSVDSLVALLWKWMRVSAVLGCFSGKKGLSLPLLRAAGRGDSEQSPSQLQILDKSVDGMGGAHGSRSGIRHPHCLLPLPQAIHPRS